MGRSGEGTLWEGQDLVGSAGFTNGGVQKQPW